MALTTKNDLKDVFGGLASVFYQPTEIDLSAGSAIAIAPTYELPVTVDTLQISQDDPTINHYKVIGLDTDWFSTATAGEMTVQFTVPTTHKDVLTLAYGAEAVKDITTANLTKGSASAVAYEGTALTLKTKKVTGSWILENEENDRLLVMTGVALWAKPLYENASTEPFAIQFTGTLESSDKPNFAFLKKKSTAGAGA